MNDLPRLKNNGNWLEKELLNSSLHDGIPQDAIDRLHRVLGTQLPVPSDPSAGEREKQTSDVEKNALDSIENTVADPNPAVPLQGIGASGWFGGIIVCAMLIWAAASVGGGAPVSFVNPTTRDSNAPRVIDSAASQVSGEAGSSNPEKARVENEAWQRGPRHTAEDEPLRKPVESPSSKNTAWGEGNPLRVVNPLERETKRSSEGAPEGGGSDVAKAQGGSLNGSADSKFPSTDGSGNVGTLAVASASLKDSLGNEVRLLDQVRKAVGRGDSAGALNALSNYSKECDKCVLAFEAELLRVEVFETSGQHAAAVSLASKLLPSAGAGRAAERLKQIIGNQERK